MVLEISDGHQWATIWSDPSRDREMAVCRGEGCNCGVTRFREGLKWTIAIVAPWVDPAHVDLHAKSVTRK